MVIKSLVTFPVNLHHLRIRQKRNMHLTLLLSLVAHFKRIPETDDAMIALRKITYSLTDAI